ncbi:hypothetical protein EXIGLDRAFT_847486, partial [Exidia glandulosa HHB12029]
MDSPPSPGRPSAAAPPSMQTEEGLVQPSQSPAHTPAPSSSPVEVPAVPPVRPSRIPRALSSLIPITPRPEGTRAGRVYQRISVPTTNPPVSPIVPVNTTEPDASFETQTTHPEGPSPQGGSDSEAHPSFAQSRTADESELLSEPPTSPVAHSTPVKQEDESQLPVESDLGTENPSHESLHQFHTPRSAREVPLPETPPPGPETPWPRYRSRVNDVRGTAADGSTNVFGQILDRVANQTVDLFEIFGNALEERDEISAAQTSELRDEILEATEEHAALILREINPLTVALTNDSSPYRVATRTDLEEIRALITAPDSGIIARIEDSQNAMIKLNEWQQAISQTTQAVENRLVVEVGTLRDDLQKRLDERLAELGASVNTRINALLNGIEARFSAIWPPVTQRIDDIANAMGERLNAAVVSIESSEQERSTAVAASAAAHQHHVIQRISALDARFAEMENAVRRVETSLIERQGAECPCLYRSAELGSAPPGPGPDAVPVFVDPMTDAVLSPRPIRDVPPHFPHVPPPAPPPAPPSAPSSAPSPPPPPADFVDLAPPLAPRAPLPAQNQPANRLYPKLKDLPKCSTDPDAWITQITAYYTQMRLSLEELVPMIPMLLKDKAMEWFYELTPENRAELQTWAQWCDANYIAKKGQEMRSRIYCNGELFIDYYTARTKLQRVVMSSASDEDRILDLLSGLPPYMHAHLKTGMVAEGGRTLINFRRVLLDLEPSLHANGAVPGSRDRTEPRRGFTPSPRDRNVSFTPRDRTAAVTTTTTRVVSNDTRSRVNGAPTASSSSQARPNTSQPTPSNRPYSSGSQRPNRTARAQIASPGEEDEAQGAEDGQ